MMAYELSIPGNNMSIRKTLTSLGLDQSNQIIHSYNLTRKGGFYLQIAFSFVIAQMQLEVNQFMQYSSVISYCYGPAN